MRRKKIQEIIYFTLEKNVNVEEEEEDKPKKMNGKQRERQRGRELHMYIVQESVPKKNIEYADGEYFERIIRDYRRSLNEKEWQVHQNSHKKRVYQVHCKNMLSMTKY